jgi:putative phosphoesterase
MNEVLVGVISDTHGLLRPSALDALRGCELIVHAGDVGKLEVLEGLRAIAPVMAVRGNVDHDTWNEDLPATRIVQAGEVYLYVLHNLHDLDLDPAAGGFCAVISGHSHRASVRQSGGVLYLNPGAAGPRRFSLPLTLALLHVRGHELQADIVPLEG